MNQSAFENGAQFAEEAQQALTEGRPFLQKGAVWPIMTLEGAASYLDTWKRHRSFSGGACGCGCSWEIGFWSGYLSRWKH